MATEPRPTVTVAILTRDRIEYLDAAIKSVLSGSIVPDRVVVIDNSQRDPSLTRKLCDQFERVEYAAPVGNLTSQANHNRAVDSADTDYVCLLHDDDVHGPEFLARGLVALSADPKANLFAVNYGVIDGNDRTIHQKAWYDWRAGTFEPADFLRYVLSTSSPVHISAAMMRTVRARECRQADIDGNCADMRYFFELGGRGRVILCDEPLVSIRVHQTMISTEAGFVQSSGSRKSQALALAPREWAVKKRFLDSPTAKRVLGGDLKRVRVAAARRAARQLAHDLRGYPIGERVRIAWAIVPLLPYVLGA